MGNTAQEGHKKGIYPKVYSVSNPLMVHDPVSVYPNVRQVEQHKGRMSGEVDDHLPFF